MSYEGSLKRKLKEADTGIGDKVRVSKDEEEYKGTLMPSLSSPETLVLKLESGYNVGISGEELEIEKIQERSQGQSPQDPGIHKPSNKDEDTGVTVLLAGGTIASRVDYRTGAVKPSASEDELISFSPEISSIADIEVREVMQTLSENISIGDWQTISEEVKKEIDKGKDGVIVAHGTDTMGYTAAALSFMLEDIPVPVVLVGSQRSSDRGSSDAHQNLVCAVKAATTDIAEVTVCMHGESSDSFCYLHPGTKVRKMHTSRRDAFETINREPYAKIYWETLEVEKIRKNYNKKDNKRKVELNKGFEEDVELVKTYPGMDPEVFEKQLEESKGVVIEGTGLGHLPLKDEKTREALEKYIDSGGIAFMTSQCLYGRVNMNVYETGVDLQELGVIGNLNDMLPETAYVKLSWLLGNYRKEKTKELMTKNLRGEISQRTKHEEFEGVE